MNRGQVSDIRRAIYAASLPMAEKANRLAFETCLRWCVGRDLEDVLTEEIIAEALRQAFIEVADA